jgi:two-component system sensor histidine kinase/response regulator
MPKNSGVRMDRIFLLWLGLVLLCMLPPAAAVPPDSIGLTEAEQSWLENHPKIRIGIMNAWPPMDYVDEEGRPQGIGTRYIEALNERLGDRLQIVPGPWDEIYEAVKDKRLDALMDVTPRPDRAEFLHFTSPYIDVPHLIFTRKYESFKGSLQELDGKKVAVERQFFLAKVLREKYPQITTREFDNTRNALRALAQGHVDAYVGNRAAAMHIIETELITNIVPAGKIAESSSINAIGVRKDWPVLRSILQKALDDIPAEERARIIDPPDLLAQQGIEAKQFLKQLSAGEKAWLNAHKPFHIAVMDGWPPFNYVDGSGVSVGIGIDYLNALNKRLGNVLKPVPGEWKRIYGDVKEKRLDAIMDITPKPEREPFFHFTTPYLEVPHVIVARKDSVFLESELSLEGKILALEQGFGNVRHFQKYYPKVQLKLFANTALALDAVSRGDADAYAGNRVVALYLMEKHFITNLRVHGSLTKPASALTLGVRKDWPQFRDILQRALDDISQEEHREIINHWIHTHETEGAQQYKLRLTAEELKWLSEHREITIGVDGNWPPIDFINAEGEHAGITPDYLNLLSKRLNVKFVPEKSPKFKDMLQKVMGGELKVGATIAYNDERAEKLYFSKPFYQVQRVIIARDDSEWIGRIEDLYGRRVAIEDGFITMALLQEKHPQIELLPVASSLEALQLVSEGGADAYVGNQAVVGWLLKRNQLNNLRVAGNPGIGSGPQSFAVSRAAPDWRPLIGIIDKALANITEEDRRRIEQRWLGKDDVKGMLPRVILTNEEHRWLREHKTIRLGVDADWAPVEFIDLDGEYKGISSEYTRIFAAQLGINWVKPRKISWAEVQARLKNKSLDVAPMISRTPEREAYLNFTKPYLDFPYVIFNRRGTTPLKGLDDLKGMKVAAIEGYAIVKNLRQDHPLIELRFYQNAKEALQAVSIGEVDAFVGSLAVGGYLIGHEGLTNLQVAAPTSYSRKYGIGVRKDWPELVGILNKAIDTLDDELKNDIFRRWSTVKYEQHVDYTLVWQILGVALLILAIGSIWILQIRRSRQIIQQGRERLELTLKSAQLGAWEARVSSAGVPELLSLDETFCRHHGMPEMVEHLTLEKLYGYINQEDIPSLREGVKHFLLTRGKADISLEYRVHGEDRWLYSKGHTLEWDESGRPKYVVGITQDITERHKANEALQQANRFKGEFLANMSHEIRTPMNAIIGLGYLLGKTSLVPKQSDYVHKIQISAKSLLGIIDDILDFSKIEAGRLTIESIPFSFEDIFESISIMAATRIGDSPIEFLYDFDSDIPPKLEGDPYRIGQILTNLVSNAVKFTQSGSIVVRVAVKERDRRKIALRFEVEDTGIGIDPDKLELLFEPFTQVDGSTTRNYGGTGLGLSICQKLCTLMHGSIGAESEPGKGSLFYFELPLRYSEIPSYPTLHRVLRNLQVLLVDDNPTAQAVLRDMLESMTFKVTVAGSGAEALDRLKESDSDFDLVLLDWQMPNIDGFETIRRIDKMFGDERPVVIMMTAYGREIMEQELGKKHLDGLLVKPLTPSILFDAIVRAYESKTAVEPSPETPEELPSPVQQLQGTVLLVEDNEINRQVGKELLEQMGLEVNCVENGEQAVKYCTQQRPELVLMDIQMPVMDGYEATRCIRELPGKEDLPIFAMTANALVGDADRSVQAGMNGHIAKPIDPDELYQILSEYLESTTRESTLPPAEKEETAGWTPPESNPPEIDLPHGVKQVGGNSDFYLKLLGDFLKNHGNSISELEEMMKESRLDDARRTAHTLKGVAGNIGAHGLGKIASDLEVCFSNGELPPEELFGDFSRACESLFAAIQNIIPASKKPEPETGSLNIDSVDVKEELHAFLSELQNGEATSVNLYKKLKPFLNQKLESEQADELDKLISGYELEEAAALLKEHWQEKPH